MTHLERFRWGRATGRAVVPPSRAPTSVNLVGSINYHQAQRREGAEQLNYSEEVGIRVGGLGWSGVESSRVESSKVGCGVIESGREQIDTWARPRRGAGARVLERGDATR